MYLSLDGRGGHKHNGKYKFKGVREKKKSSLQKKGSKKGLKVQFFPYPITPEKKRTTTREGKTEIK